MSDRLHRRRFLRTAAVTGVAPLLLEKHGAPAANDTLDLAVIGVGGRGRANLRGVSKEHIAALCDIDEKRLGQAARQFPKARTFTDFRRMYDEMEKHIDAVVVSTPDHTHAPAAAAAMRMNKHCYCEKPLAHNVREVRTLTELAAEHDLRTQLGTQIHAGDNYRRVVELIRAGAIGAVGEVHVWLKHSYGGGDRPADTPPVPEHIDWDLWLGPAPERPYHPCYLPGKWRRWWDFGCGALGDFGCHYMDLPFWALGLKYPSSVKADGPPVHPEGTPPRLIVRYAFPRRAGRPPVRMTWYDGGRRPPVLEKVLADNGLPAIPSGVLFVGDDGMLAATYIRRMLLPKKKFADYEPPKPTIPKSAGHHREWIAACKTGGPTTCSFDYSGPLTETVLLGNVAYRSGEKLSWDAAALKTGSPKADRYLRRNYREGWSL